jgi:hypothetical protein
MEMDCTINNMDLSYNKRFFELAGLDNVIEMSESHKRSCYGRWYDDNEREIINIVESRGIAVTNYDGLLNEIKTYVESTISYINPVSIEVCEYRVYNANGYITLKKSLYLYEVDIPDEILRKFGIDDLSIKVYTINYLVPVGYHIAYHDMEMRGEYNKDENKITITCPSTNGKLNIISIREILTHEINHYYKAKKMKDKGLKNLKCNIDQGKLETYINGRDEVVSHIAFIIYRLWIPEEMQAGAASVYGALKDTKLLRSNFGNDVRITKAFDEYSNMGKWIESFKYITIDYPFKIAMQLLGINATDIQQFKEWFINKSRWLNYEYLMRIGKAASQAYDENELKDGNGLPRNKD